MAQRPSLPLMVVVQRTWMTDDLVVHRSSSVERGVQWGSPLMGVVPMAVTWVAGGRLLALRDTWPHDRCTCVLEVK
jgi:hypothetical protein